ncbi:MAG: hypothetical protein AAB225_04955 [Acidobacteriota bacterium]
MRVRALSLAVLPLLAFGAETFRFDTSAVKILVWGRGAELPRRYFDEYLPALFERTLVLERFEPGDGALEWIFTGERAGFTVRADRAQVRVSQRFYDSFGLSDQPVPKRHPERTWLEESAPYAAPLRSIKVVLDHRLGLAVFVNGQQAARQTCLFDVRRHQLAFTGQQGRIEGSLAKPEAARAVIRVDPAGRHQTMLGFGGITTPMAWRELSSEGRRRWWRYLREYNLLLHREYPMGVRLNTEMTNWDRPEDATPHYYGDNFPNGEVSDFEYLKAVRRVGARVLFEFWEVPVWARRDGKVADPEPYARAIVRYCQLSRDRAGAPPDIVGIQNERSQPPEVWHAMTLRLRQELDRAGFRAVKIHMQDASSVAAGIKSARAFRASDAVWSAIDYSASHMYDYQKFLTDPDGFDALLTEWSQAAAGKPFLSTEISINQAPYQILSYRLAFGVGQLYHKNLTIANASALLYCWLLLNVEQPTYGATRSLFVPDPARGFVPAPSSYQLRVFGAYSRRIREGMARVEATSSNPNLLVTAFAGDRERTLVVLNRSLQPQRVSVDWKGAPFRYLEVTDPYRENAVLAAPAADVLIEPGAIATLSTVPLLPEVQP